MWHWQSTHQLCYDAHVVYNEVKCYVSSTALTVLLLLIMPEAQQKQKQAAQLSPFGLNSAL